MSGLALEVMANSDNVFRLGLTAKRIDVEESIANVLTASTPVSRPHGSTDAVEPAEEFQVTVYDLRVDGVAISGLGPRIAIGLEGDCLIEGAVGRTVLSAGGAVFLPHGDAAAAAAGPGRLAVISVPGLHGYP